LSFEVWVACAVGAAAILTAVAVAIGWETHWLTKFSFANVAAAADEHAFGALRSEKLPFSAASAAESQRVLADEGPLPELSGATWLNSAPLSAESLRGKVVLVDFWTYSCINSLRNLPYIKSWAAKYKDHGLVVIGVHAPEFGFEHERANVELAVREYGVTYPVAIDSNYRIWNSFDNAYWPADYFIDAKGRIRYHHFGEGDYADSERVIRELLVENGATALDGNAPRIAAPGVEAPPGSDEESPETYLGYRRTEHFASPERLARDAAANYSAPARLALNHWGLDGSWNVGPESALLQAAGGKIRFRFHSRDLHVVLVPAQDGRPVRFKVRLDGSAPGANCGSDCAADGSGEVREPRLYQLIRQKDRVEDRTFEVEFLDPGVRAFVFTFG
jgi:thiol-disulfide isomerase/thioredoxin